MTDSVRYSLFAMLFVGLSAGKVAADGGTVRLSEPCGSFRVTIFTSPTPLRAGPVDISLLVQDAESDRLAEEVRVWLEISPLDYPDWKLRLPAERAHGTNKLYHSAQFNLPAPGWWRIKAVIEGVHETVQTEFQVEAAEPLPRWAEMWPWIALPLAPIALFILHSRIVKKSQPNM